MATTAVNRQTRQTLFDIGAAHHILESWLFETEGELTPEIAELLDQVQADEREKVQNIALYIRSEVTHEIAKIKAEEERLAGRRKALEERVTWLRDHYLKRHVETYGTPNKSGNPEIRGTLITVAVQKNSQPTVTPAIPAADLPPQFVRVIPEQREADKAALLDAWKKEPASVAGLVVIEYGTHVRIR